MDELVSETVLNSCQSKGTSLSQVVSPLTPSPNCSAGRMSFSLEIDSPSGPEIGAEATILGSISASAKANSSQTARGIFRSSST